MLTGEHRDGLFFGCKVGSVRGATLKNCVLDRTKLDVRSIADALDFTVTLNCASFNNVELSPLLFDLLLVLLMKSVGNEEKRKKLIDVVGRDNLVSLLRKLEKI